MTLQESRQLRDLAKKVDDLPDEIIARLDDRYLKKDDAPKQFYTRMEGRFVSFILGLAVTVLTIWNAVRGQ